MQTLRGRVQGKVALITGGTGAIGQAIALRLGQEGAQVVLTDIDPSQSAETLEVLAAAGVQAIFAEHDVRDETSWQSVVAQAKQAFGSFDILVNNAGIAGPPPDGFEGITFEDWRRTMSVNLDGVFLGMRQAVLSMKDGGGGSIINIGSVAAYIGTPGGAAYGASKGGVRTLTKQAAVACARKGYRIRVNAIHPCYIWTPLAEKAASARFGKDGAQQGMRDLHPFKCLGEPDDVAYAALYLASDESRLVNGTDLIVDGALLST
jgi:NAD(P)-dependent dehydrogenase (short-subunit alcohol dehydrogenase family)